MQTEAGKLASSSGGLDFSIESLDVLERLWRAGTVPSLSLVAYEGEVLRTCVPGGEWANAPRAALSFRPGVPAIRWDQRRERSGAVSYCRPSELFRRQDLPTGYLRKKTVEICTLLQESRDKQPKELIRGGGWRSLRYRTVRPYHDR